MFNPHILFTSEFRQCQSKPPARVDEPVSTQLQHNINTTLTQHNTHQKSKCKSVDTRTTGWDGVGSRHENPMK